MSSNSKYENFTNSNIKKNKIHAKNSSFEDSFDHFQIQNQGKKQNNVQKYGSSSNEILAVPIFKIQNRTQKMQCLLSEKKYFALGTLIGQFYDIEGTTKISNVIFAGQFKGSTELKAVNKEECVYFEGSISHLSFLQVQQRQQLKQIIKGLAFQQTSFKGYFKGGFYNWADIQRIKQKMKLNNSVFNSSSLISETQKCIEPEVKQCNQLILSTSTKQISKKQYFLPSVLRFQVNDVREINLQKSMAVISGQLYLKIFYDKQVGEMIERSLFFRKKVLQKRIAQKQKQQEQNKKIALQNKLGFQKKSSKLGKDEIQKKKKDKAEYLKMQSLLKITVNFNRDFNLVFPLYQQEQDEDDAKSQDSQWTIQDKTWDLEFQHNEEQRTFEFRVWKKFNAQIDNSYGAFFAPFNLSVLRLVVTVHAFNLLDELNSKVKINLLGTDVLDFNESVGIYNPFKPLNDLDSQDSENYNERQNRLYKVNNFICQDNGVYTIADNRLTLFPHYKNTLINKCTANEDFRWGLGIVDKQQLLKIPPINKISQCFQQFNSTDKLQDYKKFSTLLWNYFFVEIPIYRYIMIQMLQIFVPLILLSIVSLLIFDQSNGISSGGFTTLAYRIVNVCSLLIAYVSLIPTLRKSLPPMPSITLVEIITYTSTIPNMLAILHSMLSYTVSLDYWIQHFSPFSDGVFIFCLVLTLINTTILGIVLIIYGFKEYTSVYKNIPLPTKQQRNKVLKYRSPWASLFMEQIQKKRPEFIVKQFKRQQLPNKQVLHQTIQELGVLKREVQIFQ